MSKEKKVKERPEPSMKYNIPEGIITRFATNMVVQIIESEFKVSFFEIQRPILIEENDKDKFNDNPVVTADCVGSVIITPDRMPKFIEVLQQQLDLYEEFKGKY